MPLLDQRLESLGRSEVDFVDHDDCRNVALRHLVENLGRAIGVLNGVGHVEQHVSVLQCSAHETHHRLLELVVGFENTRRIRVNNLKIIAIDNTHNAVARGLRLRCDDRQTLTHEGVHQRRFTHVWVANNIYKT